MPIPPMPSYVAMGRTRDKKTGKLSWDIGFGVTQEAAVREVAWSPSSSYETVPGSIRMFRIPNPEDEHDY